MVFRTCEHQRVDNNSTMFKCSNPESNNTHCIYSDVRKCTVSIPRDFMYISYMSEYDRWEAELDEMCDSGELDNIPMGLKSLLYEWIEHMRFADKDLYELKKEYKNHRHPGAFVNTGVPIKEEGEEKQ